MERPIFDPGLTQQFSAPLRRAINKDGSFNVRRHGTSWRDSNFYLHLINTSWGRFLGTVAAAYLVVNIVFALIYFALGPGQLRGAQAGSAMRLFLNGFFFSAHTLTTVGYGSISPEGIAANFVAAIEAMLGLMGFALATGLTYGRVSRPSARIAFSGNVLIAPYRDQMSLQFRIVNKRANTLMELEARVILMTVEGSPGKLQRKYEVLPLERDRVVFFPLTWTVVHPIESTSPLYGKSRDDLERLQAELLILIKGFDETFSQTVHARYSYRFDEMEWHARFTPAFTIDPAGDIVVEVDKVGAFDRLRVVPEGAR